MADPFRLKVLKAITDALETITPANGYQNNMVGAVFRGRTLFGQGDPLPMISILEAPLQPDQMEVPRNSRVGFGDLTLLIQGFVKDDPMNPTDPAHILLAEAKKALAKTDTRGNILGLGSEIDAIRIGGGTCRPPDGEVSDKAYFWLPVSLSILEDLDDPFS